MSAAANTFIKEDPSSPGHYGASETALLLLDWHGAIVSMAKAEQQAEQAAGLAGWARSKGIEVIHCLIDVDAKILPTTKDSTRLGGMLTAMKQAADEPSSLADATEKLFLRRPGHVSAFRSPGLEAYLQEKGIKSLLLSGVSTSSCVMRTAVAATDLDFVTTVVSDACKDPSETSHEFILSHIVNNRGFVATVAEVQAGLEEAERQGQK